MRTVRSLLRILSKFPQTVDEVVVIHAPGLEPDQPLFDPGQLEELEACGMKVRSSTDLQAEVPDLDVVYINAIAWVGTTTETPCGLELSPSESGAEIPDTDTVSASKLSAQSSDPCEVCVVVCHSP